MMDEHFKVEVYDDLSRAELYEMGVGAMQGEVTDYGNVWEALLAIPTPHGLNGAILRCTRHPDYDALSDIPFDGNTVRPTILGPFKVWDDTEYRLVYGTLTVDIPEGERDEWCNPDLMTARMEIATRVPK